MRPRMRLTPPTFAALAQRPAGANAVAYPGRAFAELQAKAYPDLRTLVLDRPVEEAFELVEEAVRRLRWRVVAEEPPMPPSAGKPAEPGMIEATEQTLIVGFTDDIVIRIEGGAKRSRIDARSASRYGGTDFGQNAMRLRRLLAEIRARAELTPSAAVATRTARANSRRGGARAPQTAESARSAESGESQRTRPREIRCSTCASTERDAALVSLGSRPR